jgi:hypothetical protein
LKYTVRWSGRAVYAVAQLWLDFPDLRSEITQATATVDHLLQFNPAEQGESRNDDRRILFVPPLVVIFRESAATETVSVLDVRQIKRRDKN